MMANMPPMRFNYQQRVGRAGRRDDPLALALTICRGRSHDDYYFDHPEKITGDPPPAPYLDLSRPEILQRVLAIEVLRQAFRQLGVEDDERRARDQRPRPVRRRRRLGDRRTRPTSASGSGTTRTTIDRCLDALLQLDASWATSERSCAPS